MFENLTPLHPTRHLKLERDIKSEENITSRVIDMIAPIGCGQRACSSLRQRPARP
jgi:transcription termination factor Rho